MFDTNNVEIWRQYQIKQSQFEYMQKLFVVTHSAAVGKK